MFISKNPAIQRVAQIYAESKQARRLQKSTGSASYSDEVTLSPESRELQTMLHKLQSAPDVRPRAEEIKVAVENGTYKVSPKQVAEAMVRAQKGTE
ncbi:MAG: flagellar biosynthesis anti-sigma factor FlgM [Limnochordia bacterium]|jgi:flagellar biosynthesis anti-sigma factor FlgM|nr:flagellar biosynthesis anti-sigma factor FlgM [Bacillota bacterium]HBG08432.1 flagellar biosynthesis anti-sigma factor FlgM [Bacillota bacterium]